MKSSEVMNLFSLEGKTALVTGACYGIGFAIATALHGAGAKIAFCATSDASVEKALKAYEAEGITDVKGYACDVTDEPRARELVARVEQDVGPIDILVNNAGIPRDGPAARMSDDDFDAVIDINLKGTFHCCRAAAKLMMKQRWGRIVNMSSVVGVYGNAGQVNYAASKAGVIGLTKSLARELARRNITANAVAPGFIATDMTDALSDAQREAIVSRIGSGRLGEPDDIAHLVRFLASDEASYITGQVICVDGGMSL